MSQSSKTFSKLTDGLVKYLTAAFLIFVPLYPKFPLFTVPGTYVAIRAEDFLILTLALALLSKYQFFLKLTKSPLFPVLTLFWLTGLLATLSGIFLTQTASGSLGLLHWARRVEYLVPFFAGLYLVNQKGFLKFFYELSFLVALGVLGYGLAQIYLQAPVISTQNEEFSKGLALTLQPGVNLASTFAGHYDLSTYLVMTISLFFSLLLSRRRWSVRLVLSLFLLAMFWLQLRTGSRMAILALTGSVSLISLLHRRYWLIPVTTIIIGLGSLLTPSIAGRFADFGNIFKAKFNLTWVAPAHAAQSDEPPAPEANEELPKRALEQDRSTSIRFDISWPRALRAFYKNPLLGTGYSSLTLASDNDYLRALGETGLLGLLTFLSLLLTMFSLLISNLRSASKLASSYLKGVVPMFLAFLLIATFIDVFEASKVATLFWFYLGLGLKKI